MVEGGVNGVWMCGGGVNGALEWLGGEPYRAEIVKDMLSAATLSLPISHTHTLSPSHTHTNVHYDTHIHVLHIFQQSLSSCVVEYPPLCA